MSLIKKGYTRTYLFFTILFMIISVNFVDSSILILPNVQVNDEFIWKVNYTNSIDPTKDKIGKCRIDIVSIGLESIDYLYTDTYETFISGNMNPNMTLRNFPMGTINEITSIPTLEAILPKICLISINWSENAQLFLNGSYSPYQYYSIENPAESIFIYNNLFFFKGAFRRACIFRHEFYNNTAEEFKLQGDDVNGFMESVYLRESGILLQYEFLVTVVDTEATLGLSIKLEKSTVSLGLSKWSKILTPITVMIGPYIAIGFFGGMISIPIYNKRRKNSIKEAKEKALDIIKLESEVKEIQKNITDDYYFIETCPFCMKDYPASEKKCPYCQGRK
ncbi:MAG TPA: hypothetical protein VMZ29_14475 [Candidatus Bathyarchaeia archaeon]|nr:hypothetical protein [Candidatus Bathyarchaeia archaeon]